ncbi:hypothetical protein yrohd0001_28040 [Yersinia rohdei ATCC 43380]|nr:hypothetical protein yrohd0001_28040 [Yersinia rohdei ATCC 43380]
MALSRTWEYKEQRREIKEASFGWNTFTQVSTFQPTLLRPK